MTEVFETIAGLRKRLDGQKSVALVATMGALHDGHLSLVRHATEIADTVVVSIFVNPMQFDQRGDLDRYPRDLDADLRVLPAGVVVFAPSVEELYPQGESSTVITAGDVGSRFEGTIRPGHFDGMLTVVAKLFNIVRPQVAVFGQKDAQQVFLVKRMVRDLDFPLTIEISQTVREADGLAMSSRNRFLSREERHAALVLSRALDAAAASAGNRELALAAAHTVLSSESSVQVNYMEIVAKSTFLPVTDDFRGAALAIVAAQVGATRLIDNCPITFA